MTEEKYQGWNNRETWAVNLWLSNDEGLYRNVCGIVEDAEEEGEAEEGIKGYVEELEELVKEGEAGEELKSMFSDIGSLWRVDWGEIAEAWRY